MRFVSPARAAVAVLLLALVGLVALYLIPSNSYYVFVPDRAHPLTPLVEVSGKQPRRDGGGVYFVDVRFRKARLLEDLLNRPLAKGATMEPATAVLGTASEKQQRRIDLNQMEQSQATAAALALNRVGYDVKVALPTLVVSAVERKVPAARVLQPHDRLLAVDGSAAHTVGRLRQLLDSVRPGQRVRLRVARKAVVRTIAVPTVADPADPGRAVIGIYVREDGGSVGKLPLKVNIDTGGIGGPSAGLAFALDLMEVFGRDVDRGYKVAATGELELDGTVVAIGAVKQKTIGARQAGVDVFLVPAGPNAREARKYAKGLRIIPVKTLPQALSALATLPSKSRMTA
jgi:PDZ domain-containing protein